MVASIYVDAIHSSRARVMASIFLARHGHHDEVGRVLSGRSEIALSDCGKAQGRWLSDRLAEVKLTAILSSPRKRALETAAFVAERRGLAVRRSDALDEIDFGDWAGERFATLEQRPDWQRWNSHRGSAATPAGDTMARVIERAVAQIQDLRGEEAVLYVSHCDVIRGIVAHYLGLDADRLLSFDCDAGSLTTIALHESGGRIVTLNERPA